VIDPDRTTIRNARNNHEKKKTRARSNMFIS
jgi:hypothetical protein